MNLNRLTIKSQEALEKAKQLAEDHRQQEITSVHLFWALITSDDSFTISLLKKIDVDIQSLKNEIENYLKNQPKISGVYQTGLSRALNDILSQVENEATVLQDEYISLEHLLVAIISIGKFPIKLERFGITRSKILIALKKIENKLAIEILEGKILPNQKVNIDVKDGEFVVG